MSEYKAEIDQIVETIIFLVTESRRLTREVATQIGVTPTQLSVIKLLHEIGDLRLGELSRRIQAQNSTVTGIVDRMEEAALVRRYRAEEDRRAWRIGLTARGRAIAERAQVEPWGILRGALESLPRGDKKKLVELLDRVSRNVVGAISYHRARQPE